MLDAVTKSVKAYAHYEKKMTGMRELFKEGLSYDELADRIGDEFSTYAPVLVQYWARRGLEPDTFNRGPKPLHNLHIIALRYKAARKFRETNRESSSSSEEPEPPPGFIFKAEQIIDD
jgi:hypothetical protein